METNPARSHSDGDAVHRIITRYVPERNGFRISTPYFTSEEELDRLIAALGRLGAERGR